MTTMAVRRWQPYRLIPRDRDLDQRWYPIIIIQTSGATKHRGGTRCRYFSRQLLYKPGSYSYALRHTASIQSQKSSYYEYVAPSRVSPRRVLPWLICKGVLEIDFYPDHPRAPAMTWVRWTHILARTAVWKHITSQTNYLQHRLITLEYIHLKGIF